MLEIRLLGEAAFYDEGQQLPIRLRPRCLSLLGYLIVHRDAPHSRARIASLLWPDEPEDGARANLRRHLHIIAKAIETPLFKEVRGTLQFDGAAADVTVDLIEFERDLKNGDVDAAFARYRGDFLKDVDEDWIFATRERLRRILTDALMLAIDRATHGGETTRTLELCDRALLLDEWREEVVRHKMSALYQLGERTAALATYERFRDALHADMGVEPTLETTSLYTAIAANLPLHALTSNVSGGDDVEQASSPFAGRHSEVTKLRAAWGRAARGSGSTVFVQGEAGIGKSRLARELCAHAQKQGGYVIIGRTSEGQAHVYEPVVDALRKTLPLLASLDIDERWLSAIADVLPEVLTLRPGLERLDDISDGAARLLEGIAQVFAAIAKRRPLLLVFEDAHWATQTTLSVLNVLARRVAAAPILILITVRTPGAQNDEALHLRDALLRERRASIVALGAIEAQAYIAALPTQERYANVPINVIEQAVGLSGGNPLFFFLLMEAYLGSGRLASYSTTIEEAIAARLGTLPQGVLPVAQAGAVLGQSFSALAVASLMARSEAETYTAIDALIDSGLIRETAAGYEYAFAHAMIALACYRGLDDATRRQRHRRAALLLERAHGTIEWGRVAHHWLEAGEAARASRAYHHALENAIASYAWMDAADLFKTAVELTSDTQARFELVKLAMPIWPALGDPLRWQQYVEIAERIAKEDGSTRAQAYAISARSLLQMQNGELNASVATLDRLFELPGIERLPTLYANALATRVIRLGQLGQLDEAQRTYDALSAELKAALEPIPLASMYSNFGVALMRAGRRNEAIRAAESIRALPKLPDVRRYAAGLEFSIAYDRRDIPAMLAAAREMVELDEARANIGRLLHSYSLLAVACEPFPDEARAAYDRALNAAASGAANHVRIATLLNRGWYELQLGRFDLALDYSVEAATLAQEAKNAAFVAYAAIVESYSSWGLGRAEHALRLAQQAEEMTRTLDEAQMRSTALTLLGYELLGVDAAGAIETLREAVEYAREKRVHGLLIQALTHFANALSNARSQEAALTVARELDALLDGHVAEHECPTLICHVLATVYGTSNVMERADHFRILGSEIFARTLKRISDETTKAAYKALWFNRSYKGDS